MAGLFFARRATRRLARLHDAAQRVGTGDLAVQVAPTGRDELDELARAFDGMVGELADARSRLEYLQKVSAWQEVARRLAHEIKNPLTPIQLAVQELASSTRGDDRRLPHACWTPRWRSCTRRSPACAGWSTTSRPSPSCPRWSRRRWIWARSWSELRCGCTRSGSPIVQVDAARRRGDARCATAACSAGARQPGRERRAGRARGRASSPRSGFAVDARPARGRAAILVDDNGPGVPAAERQRIFDPYVTTKRGGTGLGLAIVRKIVIDHGGDISVATEPSSLGGARFEVEIPLAEG